MGLDAGDSNLYRYVNNNSVIAADPSGLALYTAVSAISFHDLAGNPLSKKGLRASANQDIKIVAQFSFKATFDIRRYMVTIYIKSIDITTEQVDGQFYVQKEYRAPFDEQQLGFVRLKSTSGCHEVYATVMIRTLKQTAVKNKVERPKDVLPSKVKALSVRTARWFVD